VSDRRGVFRASVIVLVAVLLVGAATWLIVRRQHSATHGAAPPSPATVSSPLHEEDLNTLTLTLEAVQRLGLRTAPVERKPVRRTRVYGGEIAIPDGQTIVISAPLSGRLEAAVSKLPEAGATVQKGQPMFRLLPLLTPEGRATLAALKIEADGIVAAAETQLAAAQIALDRAERLLAGEAGSKRAADEAQAQFDLANKALAAATARREHLGKVGSQAEQGTSASLIIECPQSGVLRNVSALSGQDVPVGAPLFEVSDLSRVWVRVPVFVGDLPGLDTSAEVTVGELTARPGDVGRSALPVPAPPSANPLTGTLDLYYQLDNSAPQFRPSQRVGVTVMLASDAASLTVPWSAVIHDIYGGTWVYEQMGGLTYLRRRVVVSYVLGDTAVLSAGPAPGRRVVVDGAAELFGTETGFSK